MSRYQMMEGGTLTATSRGSDASVARYASPCRPIPGVRRWRTETRIRPANRSWTTNRHARRAATTAASATSAWPVSDVSEPYNRRGGTSNTASGMPMKVADVAVYNSGKVGGLCAELTQAQAR